MTTDRPTARIAEPLLHEACAELGRRLRAGERYSAEEAFAAWPALAADADYAVELIYAEFTLRQELGQATSPDTWYSRFPQWRDRLRQRIELRQAIPTTMDPGLTIPSTIAQPPGAGYTPGDGPGPDAGPYELLGEIGRGGMGVVYRARHRRLNRIVALKMILSGAHAGPEERARFRREAEAVAQLQHPNIVQVFEVGEHQEPGGVSYPYMALEFVPGGSLAQRIARSPQPAREAAALVETLAEAMHHAHEHGIVHRDLKPANILLGRSRESGVGSREKAERSADTLLPTPHSLLPKITDFGLAKRLDATDGPTQTGAVLGTPGYMAPEQATGDARAAGPAADIYALGAILYELLTGRPPFMGADWITLLEQVRSAEPVPLSRLQPGVPHDLETITLKCLEKQPARRYSSAAALAEDLRRFLDGRSVLARPPSAGDRLRKFLHRNRGPAVAALLVLATLVGGVIATSWQAVRATRAQKAAEENATQATLSQQIAETNAVRAAQAQQAAETNEARAAQAQQAAETNEARAAKSQLIAEANEQRAKEGEESARLAAAAERKAKESEAAQRKQAETIADLLESVFRGLSPEESGGDLRTQLVKRLDDVAARLDKEYAGEPLVRARLRNTLGLTLADLGEYAKAVALHQQAVEEAKTILGPDHRDTLTTINNLAMSYHHAGRMGDAIPLYEQVLAGRKAKLGPEHSDTLVSMCNLAAAYYQTGRLAEALPIEEQALASLKKTLGPDHRDTLSAMDNLALSYLEAGRMDEAMPLYEQALAGRKAQFGPDHPATLSSMSSLAGAYRTAGRLEDARLLFEQVVAGRKARLGPDHPDTLASIANLAFIHHQAGRLDQAASLYEQALAGQKKKPGPDHHHTLTTMHNLAGVYWDLRRLNEAVPLYEQTLAGRKVRLGPDHPETLITVKSLSAAYGAQGRPERGEPLLRGVLATVRRQHGPESAETDDALLRLGQNLLYQHKNVEAEAVLRECLALRQAKWPDGWGAFLARSLVGASLLDQKKAAEAEPLLRQGFEGMKQRQAQIPTSSKFYLVEAAERLVDLYESLGQRERAAAYRKEVEALNRAKSPGRH